MLTHGESSAHVYMLGAHVSHFQPPGHEPVLWMSAHSDFLPGSPIRCGVPVCVPWFAMREDRPDLPNHGFARTRPWRVVDAGRASVMLELTGDDETRAMWPHEFVFRMHVELDDALTMALTVQNTGNEPVTVTEALHSYFHVADVRRVSVTGLEGVPYYSKVEGGTHCSDQPITIDAETDRVYARTAATCVLHDPVSDRRITIVKTGSATTVVWNPWVDKSRAMPDFGDDEWPGMLCIETANALDDAITIEPGSSHMMAARIEADG